MFRVTGGCAGDRTGVTRRCFVQAGALGVGGFALGDLFRARAAESSPSRDPGTSVILFWMSGGPGHMETWDPKPDAVSQFRGPFGSIPTSVPGVRRVRGPCGSERPPRRLPVVVEDGPAART